MKWWAVPTLRCSELLSCGLRPTQKPQSQAQFTYGLTHATASYPTIPPPFTLHPSTLPLAHPSTTTMPTTAAVSAFTWYNVPKDLKDLLLQAADTWNEPERSEQYMQQALAHPDSTVDVLISAYRFFFYRQNYAVAQKIAQQVLEQVRQMEKLPTSWPQLQPLLRQRRDQPLIRLYLTAYSALGYILARLGELDRARTMANRLQTIDDNDEFGASLILNILIPSEDDDDD